jgi:hypothetical protein
LMIVGGSLGNGIGGVEYLPRDCGEVYGA